MFFRLISGLYYELSTFTICFIARVYCTVMLIAYLNHLFNSSPVTTFHSISLYFYFAVVSTDASINILYSLITGEMQILKFSSTLPQELSLNSFLYVNVMMTHLAIDFLGLLMNSMPLNAFMMNFVTSLTVYNSRLTSFYVSDMFRESVRSLRKLLCNNLENKILSDEEKIVHVDMFLKAFMKLVNNVDSNIKIIRLKVWCTSILKDSKSFKLTDYDCFHFIPKVNDLCNLFQMIIFIIFDFLKLLTVLHFTIFNKYVVRQVFQILEVNKHVFF